MGEPFFDDSATEIFMTTTIKFTIREVNGLQQNLCETHLQQLFFPPSRCFRGGAVQISAANPSFHPSSTAIRQRMSALTSVASYPNSPMREAAEIAEHCFFRVGLYSVSTSLQFCGQLWLRCCANFFTIRCWGYAMIVTFLTDSHTMLLTLL